MKKLILKPGREKSILRKHPWLFSGAIQEVVGSPESGETVQVEDPAGNFLALAAFSPESKIRARCWSFAAGEAINPEFLQGRIRASVARRQGLLDEAHTAARLIFSEADGLPGLIADRYGDVLVVQITSAGAEFWREEILDILVAETGIERIYERSDPEVRLLEGLPKRVGPARGTDFPGPIQIFEDGLRFQVDFMHGHKTGFYLDQRFNRRRVREMAAGLEVLNAFSYTGAFTVSALAGGARSVHSIDISGEAVAGGLAHVQQNGLDAERTHWIEGDVFMELRTLRDRAMSFDLIVLDPPKFAPTASQAQKAARGYKDINLYAFKLLRPGGTLVTFSCSGGISADLFQKIVAGAALDAGVDAQIVDRLSQGPDHPVNLNFPESEYLKGLVIRSAS
jgi:23S rRNA (cytosine1962-C5)-methyltransferase